MSDIDPRDYGYCPALWLPGGQHFLRPDGLSVCSREQALAEIRGPVGIEEEDEPR